jgi:hypothetical protein
MFDKLSTDDVMFLTETIILMSKVISHVHYIYIASPVLKKKDWIQTFLQYISISIQHNIIKL